MSDHGHSHYRAPAAESKETTIDPVCGMTVVPGEAAGGSATHEG